ncbi:hypothetical protein [Marinivivus vitaminiproducens]|uniref:hypothetical protein n=1 Tax=Marinivivus vitaminiproducens TaxID=3035935 RepID=UPI00279A05CA|nr:hypothetical protein P4R82_18145 [Geminicoccaceae bacterium SCSIO 64248]
MAFISTSRFGGRRSPFLTDPSAPDLEDWGSGWEARATALDRIIVQVALERFAAQDIDAMVQPHMTAAAFPAAKRRRLREVARAGGGLASAVIRRAPPLYCIDGPSVALTCLIADDGFARAEAIRWIGTVGLIPSRVALRAMPGFTLVLKSQSGDPTARALTGGGSTSGLPLPH